MSKYTLHPITSSGNRISMPWDNENDPTQQEIDQYERISTPEPNQSRLQMNFARVNNEDIPLDETPEIPQVQSLKRDVASPQIDPLRDSPNLKRILFSQNPAEESLAPDIKQPETYWGGFGKSLYDDFVKPAASATGIAGMISGEEEAGAFKKSSLFDKFRRESAQVADEGGGPGNISDMQKRLAEILKKRADEIRGINPSAEIAEKARRANILARAQADPEFAKLSKGQKDIVLKHLYGENVLPNAPIPKGGVIESSGAATSPDSSFRFPPGQGAYRDPALDIMHQPSLFHPDVHPGGTGMPNVEPIDSVAARIPRRIGQSELPGVALPKSRFQTIKDNAWNVLHGSREIMASMDYSAPARQGAFLIGRKGYWQALPSMIKAGATQAGYDAVQEVIESHPHFALAQKAGVAFTDLGTNLSTREENFMSTLSNHVPLMRGSARAYTGFLNSTRMNVFGDMVDSARRAMPNTAEFQAAIPYIADYVNTATGRGSLGAFEHSAKGLNAVFFAPRLMASRVKLLNPWTYVSPKTPAFVRREALKDLFKFTGVAGGVLALAGQAGADIEVDPRSADFGKMRIGNTRLDVAAGFTQYIRLGAGLSTYVYDQMGGNIGNMKSAATGRVRKFGDSPVTPTALDSAATFFRNKEAPIPSFVTGFLSGKDIAGQPFNVPQEIGTRFTPMVFQDAYDVFQSNPELLPLTIPASIVGIGVQSYESRKVRGGGNIHDYRR